MPKAVPESEYETSWRNFRGDYDSGVAVRWKVSLPRSLLEPMKVNGVAIGMDRKTFDQQYYEMPWKFAEQHVIAYCGFESTYGKYAHADGFRFVSWSKRGFPTIQFVDVKAAGLGTGAYFELLSSSTQISRLLKKRENDKFKLVEGYYIIVDTTPTKKKRYPVYKVMASDVYEAFLDK